MADVFHAYCGALMQVGVEKMNKDTKYVLFLDDDVRLHPGSIGALTTEMEKNPDVWLCSWRHFISLLNFIFISWSYFCGYLVQIFIQTGYPLDLPSGSLGSYCIYEYHMVWFQLEFIFALYDFYMNVCYLYMNITCMTPSWQVLFIIALYYICMNYFVRA